MADVVSHKNGGFRHRAVTISNSLFSTPLVRN